MSLSEMVEIPRPFVRAQTGFRRSKFGAYRHARAGGHPGCFGFCRHGKDWIPACAGM